ncbi:hypothetical protein SAMN02745831_06753 [Streptomyces sp. PgraA7]|nr:hypothetical protein SAMN02745831_06753 [Streptomyces sp. PgraA7]
MTADAARPVPHTLRSLEPTDRITADRTVFVGFDQDLATEAATLQPDTRPAHPFLPSLGRVLRREMPAVLTVRRG